MKLAEVPKIPSVEFQVLTPSLIQALIACLGVPKATFRFSGLLKGLTEYTESLVMLTVYCSKRKH